MELDGAVIVLTAPVSTSKTETVTVQAGASPTTFGKAIGTGTDAKVAITANTCSGATVQAGQDHVHAEPHRHA